MNEDCSSDARISIAAMDDLLGKTIAVLDKGFIRVIDYMGGDSSVVQAARVSYGKGTKKVSEDAALINYLMSHDHTTPFEMCEIKLHVKLPIFVARQWIRHRTASINEYSARYSLMEDDFYFPAEQDIAYQSSLNAQGRGEQVPKAGAEEMLDILKQDSSRCYEHYIKHVQGGLAREIARTNLTLNCYTQWYWKIDLHNLLNFIRLRIDVNAQLEIREYAKVILNDIVKAWAPMVYDAFINYVLGGHRFSAKDIAAIRALIKGKSVDRYDVGLSMREWKVLQSILKLVD